MTSFPGSICSAPARASTSEMVSSRRPMFDEHLLRIEVDQHGGVGTIVDSVESMRLHSQRWGVWLDDPANIVITLP
jgi:hypothetical protein